MNRLLRHIVKLGRGMRMLLSFALVFSLTFGVQGALVAQAAGVDDEPGIGETGGTGDGSGDEGGGSPSYYIQELNVYREDDMGNLDLDNPLAYGTNPTHGHAQIETRGGSIAFGAGTQWNDDSELVPDTTNVTWSLAEGAEGIATITPAGFLQADGNEDGLVTVIATVDGSLTYDGMPLQAYVDVEIVAQSGPFVTKIQICDENGNVISPAYSFDEDDLLGTATVELGAYVTVRDPETGADTTYHVTAGNGLAAQTGGALPDITWSVSEELYGSISVDGIYRPLASGQNRVFAMSSAGLLGETVSAAITVSMPGVSTEFHPQDQLTVKVVYEKDGVADLKAKTVVKEKTFDIPYLEALGTQTITYTAKGSGGVNGFITFTGRGPYLAAILRETGLDLQGIKEIRFGTADNYLDAVSWAWLVDTDRYYFPNLDVNSEAGKIQVAPIIAIESAKATDDNPADPNYDLTGDRRFLLLFGSKPGNQSISHFQVYNIHTLYVVLEGAPPIEGGGDESEPSDDGNDGTDDQNNQNEQQSDNGTGQNQGQGSGKNGSGSGKNAGAQGVARAGDAGASGKAVNSSSDLASSASASSSSGLTMGDLTVIGDGGKWSALQAINKHKSDVDTLLLDNPFAPFVAPMCAGCFAAGGLEVLVGYRRQRRNPEVEIEDEKE